MWRNNGYDPYRGLSDEERMKAGCFHGVAFFVMIMVGLALCALFGSCTTTKYVPVIEYHTDTVRISHNTRDSIYVHDSTYIKEKGDTVLIERWHTLYKEKNTTDTTYISRTDSVPVPYPVIKEVEKQLSRRDHMIMCIGVFAIIGALCWFVWWAAKVLRRFGILRI